jgi:hypothetical protein
MLVTSNTALDVAASTLGERTALSLGERTVGYAVDRRAQALARRRSWERQHHAIAIRDGCVGKLKLYAEQRGDFRAGRLQ